MEMTDREIAERFAEIADHAGVSNTLHQSIENVSSSLIQQMAFSASVLPPAYVFAFDTTLPTGTPEFQSRCPSTIGALGERGSATSATITKPAEIRTYVDQGLPMRGETIREFSTNGIVL
jgi:ABC-type polysaccharide/polyol phosphate transport system ATPase subunit